MVNTRKQLREQERSSQNGDHDTEVLIDCVLKYGPSDKSVSMQPGVQIKTKIPEPFFSRTFTMEGS